MSTTIDERVLEMRFDNRQFESNVSNTMSTLDKLKQKLNFTGASKGLDNINTAAKNVNMTGLGSAVETVTAKFSALQVIGVTALANITNSAVNAGKNIVKSLTIAPIKSGFEEYETKMGSIQTILANTEHQGTTLNDVTAALEELNLYADKTIYNFQQMTKNIGTFTAAGVDLETSVKSIQGIANLAAVSGSTSQQASTAMYQLSQALSSGTVRLQDWNSVVNAGMGGKVFQNALIRTAAMLAGSAEDVEAWQKKNIDKFGSFRDSLTQGAWLTTDVLTKTLEQFTMAAEEGSEEWKEFKKSLMADGYTEKQAEEILKMANTATDAATKVKTFTQLMDTLRESAQSGWAQTWELIVGDFEEAKEFFTGLSDLFGGIIGKSADRRNTLLGGALNSNWEKLIDKLGEAGIEATQFEEAIRKAYGSDTHLDVLIQKHGSLANAVREGAINTDILRQAMDSLTGTGADETVSEFVEDLKKIDRTLKRGSVGDDVKSLQKALEALGHSVGECKIDGIIGPDTTKAIEEFQKSVGLTVDGIAGPETIEALEKAGVKIQNIDGDVDDLRDTCNSLIDVITKKSGRELLLGSMMNIIKAILKPMQSVGEAMRNIFEVRPEQLYSAIESFNKFTEKLVMNDVTADKLRRTFEGLFAVIKTLMTLFAGPAKIAFNLVTKVLGKLGVNILDVTAKIGDSVLSFCDNINSVIDTVTDFIATNVAKWISQFKETEFFKSASGWIKDASETISESMEKISDKIKEFNTSKLMDNIRTFGAFLSDIASKLVHSETFIFIVDKVCSAFEKLKEFFRGFKLPKFDLNNLRIFTGLASSMEGGRGIGGFFMTLGTWLKDRVFLKAKTALANMFSVFNWDALKAGIAEKFTTFWTTTSDKIKQAFEKIGEIFKVISKFVLGTEYANLPAMLSLFQQLLGIFVLFKTINFLNNLTVPFKNITDAVNNLAGKLKWEAVAAAFKAMALALGVLTACIVILANMPDMGKAWQAAGMLAGMLLLMSGLIAGLMAIAVKLKTKDAFDVASVALSLVLLIGAVYLLTQTLEKIDGMKLNDPGGTFASLGLMLLGLAAGIKIVSAAGSSSFKSVGAILTLVAALNMLLGVITSYDKYDWAGKSDAIWRMAGMLILLSAAINIASRGVKSSAGASGLAMLLLAMVFSLKILLGVITDFASMDTGDLIKGGTVVTIMLGIMAGMLVAIAGVNKDAKVLDKGQKSANSFVGLAGALLAVVAAIWLLGKMATKDLDTFIHGGASVIAILAIFTGMISAIGKSCSGLKMGAVTIALIGMGVLIAEIAYILHAMEDVPWQQSVGSASALAAVLIAMVAVLKVLNNNKINATNVTQWIGAMAGLAAIIAVLAYVLSELNGLDPETAITNAASLSGILLAMTAALTIMSRAKINDAKIGKWFLAIAGLTAVVAALAFVLYSIKEMDPKTAIGNAMALGVLAGALSLAMIPLTLLGKYCGGWAMAKGVAGLAGLMFSLNLIIRVLADMDGLQNARENAITLSILAGALSLCMVALGVAGTMKLGAIIGVGALAGLMASLFLVVWVLSTMEGLQNARANAETLALLVSALSEALVPLSAFSILIYPALIAAASLAILMGSLKSVAKALAVMDDLKHASDNADIITDLLWTLSDIVLAVGAIGIDAVFAVGAIGGIVSIVTAIGTIATAIGGLTKYMPQLDGFLDSGLGTLKKIARSLGEMISEFGVGLTSGLPEIATNISKFATNLLPFVLTMKMIGDDVTDRAMNLAEAVGVLIAANLIDSFTPGKLSDLGTELSEFAGNMGKFAISMATFKPETVTAVGTLCSAIGELTTANLVDTFTQWLPGENSLADFGTNIAGLAEGIKSASEALSEITQTDVDHMTMAADAATAMAKLNNAIPRAGGYWQEWVGDKNLSDWGDTVVDFADAIVSYNDKIKEGNIDTDKITKSAEAAKALADVATSLPSSGGYWQEWSGEKSLTTFGGTLVEFAGCLVSYNEAVTGNDFDSTAITNSATAAGALVEVANALTRTDGLWQSVTGTKDLGSFGTQLVEFAAGLTSYSDAASGIGDDGLTAIENSKTAVTKLIEIMDLLPKSGGLGSGAIAAWFGGGSGAKSGQSFGDGLQSLAIGIRSYCNTAKMLVEDDTLTTLENSKEALKKLSAILEDDVPQARDIGDTSGLVTAANNLSTIASTIGSITSGAYDYTGLDSLETAITRVAGIVGPEGVAGEELNTNFASLSSGIEVAVECAKTISGLNDYTYTGISTFKGAVESLKTISFEGITEAFAGSDAAVGAITSLVDNMASAISNNIGKVSSAMGDVSDEALSAINKNDGKFKTAGELMVTQFSKGIGDKKSSAKTAGQSVAAEAVSGAAAKYGSMKDAGNDLGDGLVEGINEKWWDVYWAGYSLGEAAVEGEKEGQKSNSPSKLTIQAGKWLGEGLVIGMERMGKSVYNAGADLGRTATKTVSGTISKIAAAINTDIDSQPTIRPVLDLSDVRSGAATIGSLFDTNSQVGVMANVGTVSTMMRGYGQNGGSLDVVNAIDKLRKDLGNISGDTYTVGNVTYDDGSNIADAVKTITRVARMERRI